MFLASMSYNDESIKVNKFLCNPSFLRADLGWYLLSVPNKSNWSVIIVFKNYMSEQTIWNVLYNMPYYREKAIPFIFFPEIHGLLEINRA